MIVTYFSISVGEPDWQLVLKAVSSVATDKETDPLLSDPYAVWSRNAPYNEDVPAARKLDTSFQGHYKSSFALNWERRNIREVKYCYYYRLHFFLTVITGGILK